MANSGEADEASSPVEMLIADAVMLRLDSEPGVPRNRPSSPAAWAAGAAFLATELPRRAGASLPGGT